MIGVVLGTSEGKKILQRLNELTEDIFVSTATKYGGELLEEYKYKILNTSPLDTLGFVDAIKKNHIELIIDSSHPYAVDASKNIMKACKKSNILYYRYERPSIMCEFKDDKNIVLVKDYDELEEKARGIKGNILDTTGSKNIDKIINMKLKNRVIHRVLPSSAVIKKCIDLGVKIDDLIGIKGPTSYELNKAFIKEYDAKAMIMKDSGIAGGTYEKLKAVIDMNIKGIVIDRENIHYENKFTDIDKLINEIRREKYEKYK